MPKPPQVSSKGRVAHSTKSGDSRQRDGGAPAPRRRQVARRDGRAVLGRLRRDRRGPDPGRGADARRGGASCRRAGPRPREARRSRGRLTRRPLRRPMSLRHSHMVGGVPGPNRSGPPAWGRRKKPAARPMTVEMDFGMVFGRCNLLVRLKRPSGAIRQDRRQSASIGSAE